MNDWKEWQERAEGKEKERKRLLEISEIEEIQKAMGDLSSEKTPATETEINLIQSLSYCTFLPGSWDKRFVRSFLAGRYGHEVKQGLELSAKQRFWLEKLKHKYRRQL